MKIYIDSDYRCHTSNSDEKFREFDVPYFDDKCSTLVEGYRYVPADETWTRKDGVEFTGEMIAPAVDYEPIGIEQNQLEKQDMMNALEILMGGGTV